MVAASGFEPPTLRV